MNYIEALAHMMRGIAICFFFMSSVMLYRQRKRSRMMCIYFVLSMFFTFCFLKDSVLIFDWGTKSSFIDDMIVMIDLMCVPLAFSFFLEAIRPQSISCKVVILLELQQLSLLFVYVFYPEHIIVSISVAITAVLSLTSLVVVLVYAVRHARYIADNYSYTENISVRWVVVTAIVYTLMYLSYDIVFQEPTWSGEILYNASFVVLWFFIYYIANQHQVMEVVPETPAVEATAPEPVETKEANLQLRLTYAGPLEEKLNALMENERLYLNPQLTLNELSMALGTNRTYVSQFLNEVKRTNFCDFINMYRIKASCARIHELAGSNERINMEDLARESGFNSVSTFYRYFTKSQGISPNAYLKQLRQGNN
ncbi:MAG: helix-turn-helix domain-containing protein [Alloprevotella sp.]